MCGGRCPRHLVTPHERTDPGSDVESDVEESRRIGVVFMIVSKLIDR